MSVVSLDRFEGCILGQVVGDAAGAPYEGLSTENLYWGLGAIGELLDAQDEPLYYTDDTQMLIGVAETLLEKGRIEEGPLCEAFVRHYDPERGYGSGARRILEAMAEGKEWQSLRREHFPGGSLGNGAAMRVAPVGLLFHRDLDQVMEQARLSALPTHVHPIGIEGAQILAVAVALAVQMASFDKRAFYRELIRRASSEEFQWQLKAAAKLSAKDTVSFLGNSLEAHRSVVTSIACFTVSPDSYRQTIERAIGLGNDTDTLAAMAGALSGAYLGISAIPAHLLSHLEDGPFGRSYLFDLAQRLYTLRQTMGEPE